MPEATAGKAGHHHRFATSAWRSALFFTAFLLTLALAMLAWGSPARAVPASDKVITLDQPDGDAFAARQYGDEWNHGYETKGGYTVVQAPRSEDWVYATLDGGNLEPSSRVAGEDAPPASVARHLRADVAEPDVEYPKPDLAPSSVETVGEGEMGTLSNTGSHHSIVLLAKFTDQEASTTPAQWNDRFFGATNSVRDYYQEASYGKLNINPAAESSGAANDGVVGWLSMPYAHPDTANPDKDPDFAPNVKLTADALKASDPYVNYRSYDADGDGSLSSKELHVTVVAAGQEGSCCNDLGKSVWGHMAAVNDSQVPTLDGVRVGGPGPDNGYTQFGEMHGTNQASIGIMVHELGHDLGLPDLYDTDSSSIGVGSWSVMGYGSWGSLPGEQYGSLPPLPDAWSRSYEGWMTPVRVEGDVQVPQAATSDTVYQMLHNPSGVDWLATTRSGTGEYFLIENRQLTGYDAALPACGILVWHIDETRGYGNSETNSDETRRMVDLEAADGNDGYPYEEETFVGSAGRGTFDGSSNPSSALYGGAPSGASMTTSGDCSENMSASIVDPRSAEAVGSDTFASASTLTLTNNGVSAGGSNAAATKEAGEPNHANNAGGKSLWYEWTAPENGRLNLNTRGSKTASGGDMDTTLGLYTGSSVNALSPVVPGNDDEKDEWGWGDLTTSMLRSVPVTAGTTYRIAVDGRNASGVVASGNVSLNLSFEPMSDPFDPTVRITSPAESDTIKGADGNVTFSAEATDNVGVERVEFYVDYEKLGTDTTGEGANGDSYSASWDASTETDGWYYLDVVAYDVSGHQRETGVRVYVDNSVVVPPTVLSSAPAPGKTVVRKSSVKVSFSERMDLGTLNRYGVKLVREGTTTPISATVSPSADRRSVTLNPYGNTAKLLSARASYRVILMTDERDGLRDENEYAILQGGGLYAPSADGKTVSFVFKTGSR